MPNDSKRLAVRYGNVTENVEMKSGKEVALNLNSGPREINP